MSEKPEALRLVDEYAQEVKDYGYVENSYVRAKLENHLACLHAECEALRADAGRYRWLRNEAWGGNNKQGPHLVEFKPGYVPSRFTDLAEEAADAAIDAAMAKEQTK